MGGKEALLEALEQGRPVLAAHGPYTAAGDSPWLLRAILQHLQALCAELGLMITEANTL